MQMNVERRFMKLELNAILRAEKGRGSNLNGGYHLNHTTTSVKRKCGENNYGQNSPSATAAESAVAEGEFCLFKVKAGQTFSAIIGPAERVYRPRPPPPPLPLRAW
ncbi:MAG: hypothetical protein WAK26_00225 [Terracidiphilus sp.]